MTDPAKTLFLPAWVSSTGRVSLRWGKPCDSPAEARRLGKAEVDAGNATLAFVVKFADGERIPLPDFVYPQSAKKIIQHWESLMTSTELPTQETDR